MRIKASELVDLALDWAVTKSINEHVHALEPKRFLQLHAEKELCFSTNWAQGGPLAEREHIGHVTVGRHDAPVIEARRWVPSTANGQSCWLYAERMFGPTPLIAIMRCLVVSRLGEEVDVPEELLGESPVEQHFEIPNGPL